jgi:maltooligosyltrehalose trehalohydrolase
VNFSVWAPQAKSVELVLAQRRIAMQRLDAGYWETSAADAEIAGGYRFSVDGAAPLPDPRSPWQPDGVHGASHRAEMTAAAARGGANFRPMPLDQAIIYEIHVGTFTAEGTYAAAAAKLPHLKSLGVTHLELMPIAAFPGKRGWGYDGVDLFAPFASYGTPQELADFISACHSEHIAVLLDVVYNHLGPDGNYLGQFGPYFTDRYKTAWGAALNFDGPQSDAVRRFVIDNALMWLRDFGFDGLRLDAVHAIFSFEAVHVLEELAAAVHKLGTEIDRSLLLIAESDLNDPRLVRSRSHGGMGLDAHWSDDFHHALHRFFTGENDGYYADFNGLPDLATALRDGYVYQGQYSAHRGRRHGRPPAGIAARQLVVSAQNHDQIGNRAHGERLSMLLNVQQLKAIAAFTLLSPFVPMLFQGEEWGASTPFLYFTDHGEELGRLVAAGRSKEFEAFSWRGQVPNPQALETFMRSKLKWSEVAQAPHAELLDWHRKLIQLRRDRVVPPPESLADSGKAQVKFDAAAAWLSFVHNGVLAVFNLSEHPQHVPLPKGAWRPLLSSNSTPASPADIMPAQATYIFIGG